MCMYVYIIIFVCVYVYMYVCMCVKTPLWMNLREIDFIVQVWEEKN